MFVQMNNPVATNVLLVQDTSSTSTAEEFDDEGMLEYETQLFLDTVQKDALVIAAKGVCLLNVIANILRVYTDSGNLVLVINCNQHEERCLTGRLRSYRGAQTAHQPSLIHNTTYSSGGTDDRCCLYLSGGVHFVTTRILVLDLLKKRVPIERITGIIILNAHRVLESGQEAFVMRLYRQSNKSGFVKAFSNDAQSFTYGFAHVERIMRNVFLREVSIWPRFHSSIIASLQSRPKPDLVELHIPITAGMERIQTCLLQLINTLIKEIKAANKTIELSEVTVENCLLPKFMRLLQTQLDAIWERLSDGSKRLAGELRVLHQLLVYHLFQSDAVTFHIHLQQYRSKDYVVNATWPYYREAEQLFVAASGRVFSNTDELEPEYCPKWKPLLDIINSEIPIDVAKNVEINAKPATVLILCQDRSTCYQLNQFLRFGPRHFLFLQSLHNGVKFRKLSDAFKSSKSVTLLAADTQEDNKAITYEQARLEQFDRDHKNTKPVGEEEGLKDVYCLTMNKSSVTTDESFHESSQYIFEPAISADISTQSSGNYTTSIVIRTFREAVLEVAGKRGAATLPEALQQLVPSYVIMYHSNVTAIRQLEFYEARKKDNDVRTKIFVLVHTGTVEEQSYLTLLKREKQAFEHLIKTKARMITSEEQDGRSDTCCPSQQDDPGGSSNGNNSSRIGGGRSSTVASRKRSVIVDMREFRSELPALLHKRGIHIEPVTITVGDYILTPDICVERKSVADLVGSLQSGRLYAQCKAMQRTYARLMLLIEFDQNRPFSWESQYIISSDGSSFEVQRKLLLLTMHFPKLRIIWSPNPYASATLFDELKEGKDEPNIDVVQMQQDSSGLANNYNAILSDVLPRLPGVTSRTVIQLMARHRDLQHLCQVTEALLRDTMMEMAASDARALHVGLHAHTTAHSDNNADGSAWVGGRSAAAADVKNKFKYKNKKM